MKTNRIAFFNLKQFLLAAIALAVSVACISTAHAATITLSPTDDSYVKSGSATTNFGTANQLIVKGGGGGTIRYVFLKFDLSSVPGTVNSATLRLYGSSSNSTADTIVAYSVSDTSWTESGITWSNMPSVGSSLSTTSVSTTTAQYYSWDVTSTAQNKGTISLAVKMTNTPSSDQADTFNSKEAASNLPQLVVTYTAPLDVPTGLTAIPGSGRVNLSWSGVTGATGYNVKRSTVSDGPYTVLSGSPVTSTSFADTSVTNGTTYYYVVTAVNAPDESGNSSQVAATPNAALSAPTGTFANSTTGSVTLTWNAVSGTATYNVYRSTASGGEGIVPYAAGITSPTYTDPSVNNGTKYYYTVTAVNSAGVESAQSTEVNSVPLSVPTGLSVTPGNAAVTLTWNDVSYALGFKIYRGTTSGGEGSTPVATVVNSRSYVDTGLTNGTTYYYKVTAYRGTTDSGSTSYGESAFSAEASATPLGTLPATPLNGIVVPGTSQVYLSWGGVVGASSYNVKRSEVSGGPYATIAGPTATSYTDTPPVNSRTYYYVVTAVNASGEGASSNEVAAQVPNGLNMSLLADSYVRQDAPDTNYGTLVNAYAATSSTAVRNAYFRFGLTGIGGTVTQARLALYGYGTTTSALNVASVSDLTWSETGITWNNAPAYGTAVGSALVGTTSQYYYFDITQYVQAQQLAGAGAVSLAVLHPTINGTFSFNTKDSANNPPLLLLSIGAPLTAANLAATGGVHQVSLSWTAVAGAATYNVYRGTSAGGEGGTPYATGLSGNSYTDTNVSDGATYYYRVSAVSINGEGSLSNEASATTQSFSLTATPSTISFDRLGSATATVSVTPVGGFGGSVTLSATGLPSGVTATFATNPTNGTSVVTFSAAQGAAVGTNTITITGTSGPLSASTTVSVTTRNAPPVITVPANADPNPVTAQ